MPAASDWPYTDLFPAMIVVLLPAFAFFNSICKFSRPSNYLCSMMIMYPSGVCLANLLRFFVTISSSFCFDCSLAFELVKSFLDMPIYLPAWIACYILPMCDVLLKSLLFRTPRSLLLFAIKITMMLRFLYSSLSRVLNSLAWWFGPRITTNHFIGPLIHSPFTWSTLYSLMLATLLMV